MVIAGVGNPGGDFRLVFARFDADGNLDPTFGNDGTTVVNFEGDRGFQANAIAQQPDGKLVAVGTVFDITDIGITNLDIGVARVTADGVLDPMFDDDGLLEVDFDGNIDQANAVAINRTNRSLSPAYLNRGPRQP